MSSYITVTINGLCLFKPFEDRGGTSIFQDCFKKNQIARGGDYAKLFHVNIKGA